MLTLFIGMAIERQLTETLSPDVHAKALLVQQLAGHLNPKKLQQAVTKTNQHTAVPSKIVALESHEISKEMRKALSRGQIR